MPEHDASKAHVPSVPPIAKDVPEPTDLKSALAVIARVRATIHGHPDDSIVIVKNVRVALDGS
jgi:hypothetical protein